MLLSENLSVYTASPGWPHINTNAVTGGTVWKLSDIDPLPQTWRLVAPKRLITEPTNPQRLEFSATVIRVRVKNFSNRSPGIGELTKIISEFFLLLSTQDFMTPKSSLCQNGYHFWNLSKFKMSLRYIVKSPKVIIMIMPAYHINRWFCVSGEEMINTN